MMHSVNHLDAMPHVEKPTEKRDKNKDCPEEQLPARKLVLNRKLERVFEG